MLEVVLSNRFKKDLKLAAFDQLNDDGQTKAVEYVEDLVLTGRYKNVLRLSWGQRKHKK